MFEQIKNLIELKKEIKCCASEAWAVLGEYIRLKHFNLLDEYTFWFSQKKFINAPVMSNGTSKAMCNLEGIIFDENKINLSYFVGASARVSDDFLDKGMYSYEQLYFLQGISERSINGSDLRLFYALNDGLLSLLPFDFTKKFENAISEFNCAQKDSLKLLNNNLTKDELINIKDRTGGYTALLLYAILFPEYGDLSINISKDYSPYKPYNNLPNTKAEALYNFGAYFSRADDLWDEPYDRKNGIKQLATERIVTWKSIKQETEYMFDGLALFYPKERVEALKKRFRPANV